MGMSVSKKWVFSAKRWMANRQELAFSKELADSEHLTSDALCELNWRRLQELVSFCFNHIPFYRRKYSGCGFESGDIGNRESFSQLPILEREEIRECEAEILNPSLRVKDLPASTTGGSTGRPLKIYCDPRILLSVMSWRTLNWWGTDVSENSGYLYRAVPEGWQRVFQKALLWPTRRNWISAASMTPQQMETFYASLVRARTKYLVGYVGAIDVFAGFLERQGYQLDDLKAVWTTSAPLPRIKREHFERVYQCDVYTQYGSCEFYWIAAECQRKCGLHIASDIRHVEVVHGSEVVSDGEYGDLVVTDLLNRAFPLIRYRIGDRGRLLKEDCECGLPFPLMDYVQGRVSDIVWLPNGSVIPGEYWTTIFDDFTEKIKSFHIHQHRDYSISIRYEPHKGADCSDVIRIVKARLMKKTDANLALDFVEADLDVSDNGKTRYVVSDVDK